MNKKEKTMTASRAARELGVSRELVFTMVRQGRLKRAGYAVRKHHRVALVTLGSVLDEKTRRKAKKGWRDGGMRIDRAHALKTRAGRQRIERRGIPTEIDRADPSAIQTVTPGRVPDGVPFDVAFLACGFNVCVDYTSLDAAKACCGAAREMCQHYFELVKTLAGCAKVNAQAGRRFKRLCFWFTVLCTACVLICIILAMR